MGEQRVPEDVEVAVDGRSRDLRVAGEIGLVDDGSVAVRREIEKAGKGGKISRESLRGDLLREIGAYIASQHNPRLFGEVGRGQSSVPQRSRKVEIVAEFAHQERVKVHRARSAAQKIDSAAAGACGRWIP